jgi:hypothetical protein
VLLFMGSFHGRGAACPGQGALELTDVSMEIYRVGKTGPSRIFAGTHRLEIVWTLKLHVRIVKCRCVNCVQSVPKCLNYMWFLLF